MLIWGFQTQHKGRESETWPSVTGEVILSSASSYSGDLVGYVPNIAYKYTVGKTVFSSKRVRFGMGEFNSRNSAEKFISKYPKGRKVPVYYDPRNPKDSVLFTGAPARLPIFLICGVTAIIVGTLNLFGFIELTWDSFDN